MSTPPDVRLRTYAGDDDLPGMTEVINANAARLGQVGFTTVDEMAAQYHHLQRCDPERDIVVAETTDARLVGYARTTWDDVAEGYRSYWLVVECEPSIDGLDAALLDWIERRATEIADGHEVADKRLVAEARDASVRQRLLVDHEFTPAMYSAYMLRPNLDAIPDRRLPAGVGRRPVESAHLRAIWEADIDAFRDHRGYVEQTELDWEKWLEEAGAHDPSLWQVAWSDDTVVGQVRTYVNGEENDRIGRKRAWTEDISTRREWRGQGVASALICASLHQLAALGFDEAALGVDTENPSGALGLYRSLGYEQITLEVEYQRTP
jgi:mycothiol synthase